MYVLHAKVMSGLEANDKQPSELHKHRLQRLSLMSGMSLFIIMRKEPNTSQRS